MGPVSISVRLSGYGQPVSAEALQKAREDFQNLCGLFHAVDTHIAEIVPEWAKDDYFGYHLVAICEDLALAMLGADRQFKEEEIQAFNTIFCLHEKPKEIATMAAFIHQHQNIEELLFQRLDRFILGILEWDRAYATQLTEKVLDYLMRLGEVIALIDNHYHREEDRLYQALLRRIRKDWYQVGAFSEDTLPALSLKLNDGTEKLYTLKKTDRA